ncbi:MAG: type II secretion system F family protein [Proteobacteria bacterium]|nr:type II secretion system F family protein [Pseudomonadota bacterium]
MKNHTYHWKGLNKNNEELSGDLMASSIAAAKVKLYEQGIFVTTIQKEAMAIFKNKISESDLALFIRQLATMQNAGVPLLSSFEIIAKGYSNPLIKTLCQKIKIDLESGATLSEAFSNQPNYFNALLIHLVSIGETSGCLDLILNKIADYQEKIREIRGKIKKALMYPSAILTISLIVTIVLLLYVVPQFETLFKNFGSELPIPTQIVIQFSQLLKHHILLFLILGFSLIFSFIKLKNDSSTFAHKLEEWILKVPLIGAIIQNACLARFSYALSVSLSAGLPLMKALPIVSKATGNFVYQQATLKVQQEILIGQKIGNALQNARVFPELLIQLITTGEESGSLESMLQKSADFYQEAVDNAVDNLSTLIEPVMMAILGILVTGLLVAMYLPIFKLGSVM